MTFRIHGCIALSIAVFASLVGTARGQAPSEDVEIEVEATPAPTPAPAPAPEADIAALRAEVARLEQRLADSDARARARANELKKADAAKAKQTELLERIARLGVSLSGYVQVQYGRSQLSEDELLQGGAPLNQDRFAVRRGRLRVNGRWKYVRSDFELDGSNSRGPTVSVRRASLSGVLPGEEDAPPLVLGTVGLSEIPLGLELQQGQDEILFLERTTASLAFFVGPVDTGAKLEGAYGPLRVQLAVMNGVPLDDRAGGPSGIDPTGKPDYLGRIGFDAPFAWFRLAGGVSYLSGTGFHPGSDATKSTLEWDDQNADGELSNTEVVQVAGRAALPSQTFGRWAVNADLELDLKTKLGWSKLYGEVTLAQNLDRGLYVADPTLSSSDVRELGFYVALTQELTEWGFVGVRYDVYDPNSDLLESRRGVVIPKDAAITTISPLAGVRWKDVGRLSFQYDLVDDALARDQSGVPTDVANNQWTVRLQGQF